MKAKTAKEIHAMMQPKDLSYTAPVKGKDFYWDRSPTTGKWEKTPVPVGGEAGAGFAPGTVITGDGTIGIFDKNTKTITDTGIPSHADTKENRQMLKNVGDATARIDSGLSNEGLAGDVATVNNSKVTYMYIWGEVPGMVYGTNPGWQKVNLRTYRGKKVTAKDVTDSVGYNETETIEDVLRQLGFL